MFNKKEKAELKELKEELYKLRKLALNLNKKEFINTYKYRSLRYLRDNYFIDAIKHHYPKIAYMYSLIHLCHTAGFECMDMDISLYEFNEKYNEFSRRANEPRISTIYTR